MNGLFFGLRRDPPPRRVARVDARFQLGDPLAQIAQQARVCRGLGAQHRQFQVDARGRAGASVARFAFHCRRPLRGAVLQQAAVVPVCDVLTMFVGTAVLDASLVAVMSPPKIVHRRVATRIRLAVLQKYLARRWRTLFAMSTNAGGDELAAYAAARKEHWELERASCQYYLAGRPLRAGRPPPPPPPRPPRARPPPSAPRSLPTSARRSRLRGRTSTLSARWTIARRKSASCLRVATSSGTAPSSTSTRTTAIPPTAAACRLASPASRARRAGCCRSSHKTNGRSSRPRCACRPRCAILPCSPSSWPRWPRPRSTNRTRSESSARPSRRASSTAPCITPSAAAGCP